jgi:uncharacterized protein (TIGR02421 family)
MSATGNKALAIASASFDPLPEIEARIAAGRRLHRRVAGLGFVHVERPLPFLAFYRRVALPADGTDKLVSTLPAYLLIDEAAPNADLEVALERMGAALAARCGAVLLLEVRAAAGEPPAAIDPAVPRFRVHAGEEPKLDETLGVLEAALEQIRIDGRSAVVAIERRVKNVESKLADPRVHRITLEVEPIYRSRDGVVPYPLVLLELRKQLDIALRSAFLAFARRFAKEPPAHAQAFGRRRLVKAAREVDRRLASVSNSLRYLLLVTPTNSELAFHEFAKSGFREPPRFDYRPLDLDPELLKREIYAIPLERVEDPALIAIFREKQQELDRLISLLVDRGTERFLWGSLQIFGGVDQSLLALAERLLARTAGAGDDEPAEPISTESFAELARREVEAYRVGWPELVPQVVVRGDVPGLMVLNGSLVIGNCVRLTLERAHALIQHEIGTHLVTYYNGTAQQLHHLGSGLAGYEALQEGLAVLAEYLVGGLSPARLRLIAARAIAVRSLIGGAGFLDTYRELTDRLGFGARAAFMVAMRVHRSGGLTKDAIYLRGLEQVLGYLASGGDTDDLLVGKVAIHHLPLVRELRLRGVIRPPRLRPRWLTDSAAQQRLSSLRKGTTVIDLC